MYLPDFWQETVNPGCDEGWYLGMLTVGKSAPGFRPATSLSLFLAFEKQVVSPTESNEGYVCLKLFENHGYRPASFEVTTRPTMKQILCQVHGFSK